MNAKITQKPTSKGLILGLVLVAQFMVVLDATITTVALPKIQSSLHFHTPADLQWVINAYTLLFGGFLLFGGRAGDLFGRQRLFVAGISLFTAASLFNGFASSATMLVIGRAAQGLGAALVAPAVLSIIMSTFNDGADRRRALGIFSAVTAVGSAAGLLFGGVLTQELSWRWVFYVNVPVGIVGGLLALRFIPNSRAEKRPKTIDVAGATAVTSGLMLLVYAIVNAQRWSWGSARTLGLIAAAVALLTSFVAIELRSKEPLIRLGIFAKRSLSTANAAMFLFVSGLFVTLFFPTLYLQDILHYSPIKTGLAFLPFPAALMITAGIGQQLMRRSGVRPPLIAGLALTGTALFLFSKLPTDGTYAANFLIPLVISAIGVGLALPALILVATTNVEGDEAGLASGIINSSQQVGGALGLAVLSSVAVSRTASILGHLGRPPTAHEQAHAMVAGFQRGFTVGTGLLIAATVMVAALLRRSDVAQLDAAETAGEVPTLEPAVPQAPEEAIAA